MLARTFEDSPAVRERVPLLFGIYGPSGSGKTVSALRMAEGMRRVVGGEIFGIDTEARRMLHYADKFKFRHIDFKAPFGPDAYEAALRHCAEKGAKVIVVDNMSHEHEGAGGVLEWHEDEMQRLSGGDERKFDKYKMLAWQRPKAARRHLINAVLHMGINAVFCFRAKEKIKLVRDGKEPERLGWMPIAGEEFIYEMTATALLMPGSKGVPCWTPPHGGERSMIKRPMQFDGLLGRFEGKQLCEEIGEAMAKWAEGSAVRSAEFERLAAMLRDARSLDGHDAARAEVQSSVKRRLLAADEVKDLTAIRDETRKALESALLPPETAGDAGQA